MKKILSIIAGLFLVGCSQTNYQTINAEEAKKMMDNQNVVVIDVREQDEYDLEHIPNSVLIPLGTIDQNNKQLPSKDQTLLIYCRSGNRSKKAAKKFISLGYEKVYDFGGIIDWPYDTTR